MSIKYRILKAAVPECGDGAFVLYSAQRRKDDGCGDFRVESNLTFIYCVGDWAAEWEPEHGPIQVWHKCEKDAKDAREHYFFDFTDSRPGNWSQIAVDRHELPQAANRGDWNYIFSVLKEWASDR